MKCIVKISVVFGLLCAPAFPSLIMAAEAGRAGAIAFTESSEYIASRVKAESRIDRSYYGFLQNSAALGSQANAVRSILIEREMVKDEVMYTAAQERANLRDPKVRSALGKLIVDSRKPHAAKLKILLGDDAYRQLQEYERLEPERNIAHEINERLGADSQLSGARFDEFCQMLFRAKDSAGMRNIFRIGGQGPSRRIPESALDPARSLLTPPQLNAFLAIQREQQSALQGQSGAPAVRKAP